MPRPNRIPMILLVFLFPSLALSQPSPGNYHELMTLFESWRDFQRPPVVNGIHDYSAQAMKRQIGDLPRYRARLAAIDTAGWPIHARVDYLLVWAEMNGMEFDHRVLRPWERMPGFYAHIWLSQSDVPAHEGPVVHGALEVWQYETPFDAASLNEIEEALKKTPLILQAARRNLTGASKDLWLAGIRRMQWHEADIKGLMELLPEGTAVSEAASAALEANTRFVAWLEAELPSKHEVRSGVGVEEYNWYLRNVHLFPFTWNDEVDHMRAELARSIASLTLEENRNRDLPPLPLPASAEEYDRTHHEAVTRFIAFLDEAEIITTKSYMDPALRAQVGSFSSSGKPDNFFAEVDYRDPLTMRAHGYHWIELARMRDEPHASPVRRDPLLYNIFQYRSEGIATAMEEFLMHAGMFDGSPRSRELVWMLVAMRASRALAGLYVHEGAMDTRTAADLATAGVPRGWFKKEGGLVIGEQDLYLSQPGYGSTYLMGKRQLEELMKDRAMQLGNAFSIQEFFDEFSAAGIIPISLIRWEMTGDGSEIARILAGD